MRSPDTRSALSRLIHSIDQRGGAQWATYLLGIGVLVGGYLLWVYAPFYLDNYKAKSECERVINETWRYKDVTRTNDAMRRALERIAKISVVEDGETKIEPAIVPEESELQVEIDNSVEPAVLRIDVTYSREIVFPVLKKTRWKTFSLDCEVTLDEVDWN